MRNDNNNYVVLYTGSYSIEREHTAVLNTLIPIENNGELWRQRVP